MFGPLATARRVRAVSYLLLAALACAATASAQSGPSGVLDYGGFAREYYLHVPDEVEAGGTPLVPLVVMLHGRGGTGAGMSALTGLDEVADEHGFIVAYPYGVDNQWNYVAGIPGYPDEVPDIQFLVALVAHLAENYPVDQHRVYVGGFSNGGFMAQRLACDAADVFAAFASVGAAGFGGQPTVCGDSGSVSLLLVHGTHDGVVPFAGLRQQGPNGPVTVLASVEQTFAFWAGRIGCSLSVDTRVLEAVRSPEMEVHVIAADACPGGHRLEQLVIVGGGHNWPGRPGLLPAEIAGAVNLDLDASRYLWDFFEDRSLGER